MSVRTSSILLICFLLACSGIKAQRTFTDSLGYLIARKTERIAGNELSDIVFVEFAAKNKELRIVGSAVSVYGKIVETTIKDAAIVSLIKDSASTDFILPIFFITVNDESTNRHMDELIVDLHVLDRVLTIVEREKKILKPVKVVIYNRKRIE